MNAVHPSTVPVTHVRLLNYLGLIGEGGRGEPVLLLPAKLQKINQRRTTASSAHSPRNPGRGRLRAGEACLPVGGDLLLTVVRANSLAQMKAGVVATCEPRYKLRLVVISVV